MIIPSDVTDGDALGERAVVGEGEDAGIPARGGHHCHLVIRG